MDSFKGSLSSQKAGTLIFNSLQNQFNPSFFPVSDGGEGSLEMVKSFLPELMSFSEKVQSPDGTINQAEWLWDSIKQEAYIELAQSSGFCLNQTNASVLRCSTFGTGELIQKAIQKKATLIHLFVGGSATVDFGMGILRSLGFQFLNRNHQEILFPGDLMELQGLRKPHQWIPPIRIYTDVKNKLCGENNGIEMYSPQKGASEREVEILCDCAQKLSEVVFHETQRDIGEIIGGGASGGVPALISGLLETEICSGVDFLFSQKIFQEKWEQCEIIITGEGCTDIQSFQGKITGTLLEKGISEGKKMILLSGDIEPRTLADNCFYSITLNEISQDKQKSILHCVKYFDIAINKILSVLKDQS